MNTWTKVCVSEQMIPSKSIFLPPGNETLLKYLLYGLQGLLRRVALVLAQSAMKHSCVVHRAGSQAGENSGEDEQATKSPQPAWQEQKLPERGQEQWQPSLHTAQPGSSALHPAESHGLSGGPASSTADPASQTDLSEKDIMLPLRCQLLWQQNRPAAVSTSVEQAEGHLRLMQELSEVSKLRSIWEW